MIFMNERNQTSRTISFLDKIMANMAGNQHFQEWKLSNNGVK